jgi:hypothetical protein
VYALFGALVCSGMSVLASSARIKTPLGMSDTWIATRKRARVSARAHYLYPG